MLGGQLIRWGTEWGAPKVVLRGVSLGKTFRIRRKLEGELTLQKDALARLQSQGGDGNAADVGILEACGRVEATWNRLAWLLKRVRPRQPILSLRRPMGEMVVRQTQVSLLLREHLMGVYTSPVSADNSTVDKFLNGLHSLMLTETQAESLDENIQLEELQEALQAMPHGKSPGPDGIPAKVFQVYSASLLPGLLEMMCEAHEEGTLPIYMREAAIVMIPKPGKGPTELLSANLHVKRRCKIACEGACHALGPGDNSPGTQGPVRIYAWEGHPYELAKAFARDA
ncbi:hypothetical protein NDU88_000935 [Pleurodeles waltl]|uniref:Uncharacterized protein n=1 Tax=Pleurodeles waltl TaxID=8319 RepID=A0AAV7S8N9_PLEWA|nr:hypothetical protein NDU88_000935 [Pleurodeles waltl]